MDGESTDKLSIFGEFDWLNYFWMNCFGNWYGAVEKLLFFFSKKVFKKGRDGFLLGWFEIFNSKCLKSGIEIWSPLNKLQKNLD